MEPVNVKLPYNNPNWKKTADILTEISQRKFQTYRDCLQKFAEAFSAFYSEDFDMRDTPFLSLTYFFKNCVSRDSEEENEYLTKSFPKLAEMALKSKNYEPKGGLCYTLPNVEATVKLDRNYVAGLIALGFLCFHDYHPPQHLRDDLTSLNFDNFLQSGYYGMKVNAQVSKLKCILHYYARLYDYGEALKGEVTFHRVHLKTNAVLTIEALKESDKQLCDFTVDDHKTIEDSGSETLQVDFANEYIGGGVLGGGNVQEEIRFSLCPELLVSMLFMTRLEPTEAIVMQGFEQFSCYTGYGGSFTYAGDYMDKSSRSADGNLATTIVAIDAIPYSFMAHQYRMKHVERDICKAYAGFLQPYLTKGTKKRVIATGNWGCGVFGGNPQLKSLLQWIAASEAGCPGLIYYTFSDNCIMGLGDIVQKISKANWKVKDLSDLVQRYCENDTNKVTMFEYIEKALSTNVTKEHAENHSKCEGKLVQPSDERGESPLPTAEKMSDLGSTGGVNGKSCQSAVTSKVDVESTGGEKELSTKPTAEVDVQANGGETGVST